MSFVTPPNFEAPTDSNADNIYGVDVRVSDGLGGFDDQTIFVTVTNQNEAPVITSNLGGPTAAISMAENGTAVTNVTATDVDAGASLTYSISGGADQALFKRASAAPLSSASGISISTMAVVIVLMIVLVVMIALFRRCDPARENCGNSGGARSAGGAYGGYSGGGGHK